MPRETMTPGERWRAVLENRKPDRLPMDYWGTEEATGALVRHLGCRNEWEAFERLHVDKVLEVAPVYVGPPHDEDLDEFGCRYEMVNYGTGRYRECVSHPLAEFEEIARIEAEYRWPRPDWWDHSVIPGQIQGRENYPIRGGGSEPFLTYCNLRGLDLAFIDLVTRPELVAYCLDRLFDLCYESTRRIYEAIPGRVLFSYVAEDFGSQEALLMSPRIIRETFIPRMRRMIDLAHDAGAYVFFHSDGAVREILPDMIAAGINILNPIQWRCKGMDRESLAAEFGGRVVFHGGVDNQQTLAFGSIADVRAEVRDNVEILGRDDRYIIAPCHNVQPITPPENVVALFETGRECGWR